MTAATACHTCGTELREGARFCDGCGAPVTAHDTHAEYKQVTVVFADVVHSMDIAAAVRASSQQLWASMEAIRAQLEGLPTRFEGADMLQELGGDTRREFLYPAYDALMRLVNLSQELLRREQGGPESSPEALTDFISKKIQDLQGSFQHLPGDGGRR